MTRVHLPVGRQVRGWVYAFGGFFWRIICKVPPNPTRRQFEGSISDKLCTGVPGSPVPRPAL